MAYSISSGNDQRMRCHILEPMIRYLFTLRRCAERSSRASGSTKAQVLFVVACHSGSLTLWVAFKAAHCAKEIAPRLHKNNERKKNLFSWQCTKRVARF